MAASGENLGQASFIMLAFGLGVSTILVGLSYGSRELLSARHSRLATYIDRDLLQYDTVWAAAGTPNAVFSVCPNALAAAVEASTVNV